MNGIGAGYGALEPVVQGSSWDLKTVGILVVCGIVAVLAIKVFGSGGGDD